MTNAAEQWIMPTVGGPVSLRGQGVHMQEERDYLHGVRELWDLFVTGPADEPKVLWTYFLSANTLSYLGSLRFPGAESSSQTHAH